MTAVYLNFILFISLFIGGINTSLQYDQIQSDCKVKLDRISSRYEGECKRGLAWGQGKAWGEHEYYEGEFRKGYPDGQGKYIYEDSTMYVGEWSKGQKEGKGELFNIKGGKKKSLKEGYWHKNEYVGKYKNPYKITSKRSIKSVNFSKVGDIPAQIEFHFTRMGKEVIPTDLEMVSGTGASVTLNPSLKRYMFTDVKYPMQGIITFQGESLMRSGGNISSKGNSTAPSGNTYQCRMEFEINEPGRWIVNVSY